MQSGTNVGLQPSDELFSHKKYGRTKLHARSKPSDSDRPKPFDKLFSYKKYEGTTSSHAGSTDHSMHSSGEGSSSRKS